MLAYTSEAEPDCWRMLLEASSVRDRHLKGATALRGAAAAHTCPPLPSTAPSGAGWRQNCMSVDTTSSGAPSMTDHTSFSHSRGSSTLREANGLLADARVSLEKEKQHDMGDGMHTMFVESVLRDGEHLFCKAEAVESVFLIVEGIVELKCMGSISRNCAILQGCSTEVDAEGSSGTESVCPLRVLLMEDAAEEDLFWEDEAGQPDANSKPCQLDEGSSGAWSGVLAGLQADCRVCLALDHVDSHTANLSTAFLTMYSWTPASWPFFFNQL
jgi:hypothetical protein